MNKIEMISFNNLDKKINIKAIIFRKDNIKIIITIKIIEDYLN